MFKFRLDALLKSRKRREEEKQRELALAARDLQKAQEKIDTLVKERGQYNKKLTELRAGAKDVNILMLYDNFMTGREDDIFSDQKKLGEAHGRVAKKQAELLEYVKKRRSIELLREKWRQAYIDGEKRKERFVMDEIASQAWFREEI
ncbi:MAG: hypothetical protein IEMM0002_0090 [bacterium]|nr:MAG: hypothetical protein IEMM0002_0090 [bacterium]